MWNDVRFAVRMLGKSPVFFFTAVVSLGLGIGAATTVFSALRAVFLRPLPYGDAERLVEISKFSQGDQPGALTVAEAQLLKERSRLFAGFGTYGFHKAMTLTGVGEAANVMARVVRRGFFETLAAHPLLGSYLEAGDYQAGSARRVLIGYAVWRTQFQGDPGVVGRQVLLDGESYTVAGVMPQEFQYPTAFTTAWVPDRDAVKSPAKEYTNVLARLKAGVSHEQVAAELGSLQPLAALWSPADKRAFRFQADALGGRDRRKYELVFSLLCGAVGLLVAIACLNVANLLLSRSLSREGEFAVRSALGAAPGRLVRQVMVESMLLATAGGVLGVSLAFAANRALVAWAPSSLQVPRLGETRLDLAVLLFCSAVTMTSAVLFGLGPAVLLSRTNLREMARTTTESGRKVRWRRLLMAAEVSFSLVLLTGAGLLLRSLVATVQVDPGFRPDHVLTMMIPASAQLAKDKPKLLNELSGIVRVAEQLPGVSAAGVASSIPMGKVNVSLDFALPEKPQQGIYVAYRAISPDYFRAIGTPLRRGREFTERDNAAEAQPVVMVNEAFARRYWPGKDAVGKRLTGPVDLTVVGVVADTHSHVLSAPAEPEMFRPYRQYLGPAIGITMVVRTQGDPTLMISALRQAIHRNYPDQPVTDVATMTNRVKTSLAEPKLYTVLLAAFAGIALLLTAVGVYGVTSYGVNRRYKEFGIRIALGAQRGDVLRFVMNGEMKLLLLGAVCGIGTAWMLSRYLESLLFGVAARDLLTFGLAPVLLIGVAAGACFLPARRAMRIDPQTALRRD